MMEKEQSWNILSWVTLFVLAGALIFLYSAVLVKLFANWGVDDNYSHGYFIPVISAYMVFALRKELAYCTVKPQNSGLITLGLGLLVLVVGKIGSEYFLQRFSLILVLLGVVQFLLGKQYLKRGAIPILYLVFMIPLPAIIWNKIAFPMQLFGSYLTEQVVYAIRIPIFREGNVLHLANTSLEVVAACSGLRSLVTMFALAGALSFFSGLSPLKKCILFFTAAPIAILANTTRLTLTAVLASMYGSDVAHGFLHDFSGIFIFFLGLFMLVTVNRLLSSDRHENS